MRRTSRAAVVAAGTVVFVFIGGAGAVTARNPRPTPDGAGPPLTGEALRRASDAALAATGGDRVSGTGIGDGGGSYEVEVSLADGRRVDVRLDRSFAVVQLAPDATGSSGGG